MSLILESLKKFEERNKTGKTIKPSVKEFKNDPKVNIFENKETKDLARKKHTSRGLKIILVGLSVLLLSFVAAYAVLWWVQHDGMRGPGVVNRKTFENGQGAAAAGSGIKGAASEAAENAENVNSLNTSFADTTVEKVKNSVKFSGAVISGKDSYCILNGDVYRAGDSVKGVSIIDIEPERVKFSLRGEEFFIER